MVLDRSDTLIPTPDTTLRKLVIAAEQSKALKAQIGLYEEREVLLQKLISGLNDKYRLMDDYCTSQFKNFNEQITLYKDQINGYEKLVKRERRKRRLATAGGILTTGLMAYLFLTK